MSNQETINEKINIAVIGLGYVGLPLAAALGKHFKTIGFDSNLERIQELRAGYDRNKEIDAKTLSDANNLVFEKKFSSLKSCNFIIVTVPTPVDLNNNPDLQALDRACKNLGKYIQRNSTIIFESTVYPGATEEICIPTIEKYSKLKYERDFFVAYSPERINPGDTEHKLETITKVVGSNNPSTVQSVSEVYGKIIKAGIFKVNSIKVAETAKVIENVQRDLNIALMNELSEICQRLEIYTLEVLEAAQTKWNFVRFTPGLVGGHCIGVDPYYLTHKAEKMGYHPKLILAGRSINDDMSSILAKRIISVVKKKFGICTGTKVGILGLTFKENCSDFRNSKIFDTIHLLVEEGFKVCVSDPNLSKDDKFLDFEAQIFSLKEMPAIQILVIAAPHKTYFEEIDAINKMIKEDTIIFDLKGRFPDLKTGVCAENYFTL